MRTAAHSPELERVLSVGRRRCRAGRRDRGRETGGVQASRRALRAAAVLTRMRGPGVIDEATTAPSTSPGVASRLGGWRFTPRCSEGRRMERARRGPPGVRRATCGRAEGVTEATACARRERSHASRVQRRHSEHREVSCEGIHPFRGVVGRGILSRCTMGCAVTACVAGSRVSQGGMRGRGRDVRNGTASEKNSVGSLRGGGCRSRVRRPVSAQSSSLVIWTIVPWVSPELRMPARRKVE